MTARLVAILLVVISILVHLLLAEPFWLTNDDPGMAMAVHGFGVIAEGFPPWTLHSNIAWAYLARWTPGIAGVLGYSVLSYLAITAALVLLATALVEKGHHPLVALLAVMLPGSWAVLVPQYTITAGLLGVAAIAAALVYRDQDEQGKVGRRGWLLAAGIASIAAFLIRDLQLALILLVAIPLLPFRLIRNPEVQVGAGCILLVCLLAWGLNRYAYSDPIWRDFVLLNSVRDEFTDFLAANRLVGQESLLASHGFTLNDSFLLQFWFFVDPQIADPSRMQALVNDLGPAAFSDTVATSGFRSLWMFPYMLPLLLGGIVLTSLYPSMRQVACWGLLVVALFALGYAGRPALEHMLIPLYGLMITTTLLQAPSINPGIQPPSMRVKVAVAVLLAVTAANLFVVGLTLSNKSAKVETEEALYRDALGQGAMVWSHALRSELVHRPLQRDSSLREFNYYALSQTTLMPATWSFALERVDDGFIPRLLSAEGVMLITYELYLPLLVTYCAEHHGRLLETSVPMRSDPLARDVRNVRCHAAL